MSEVTATIIEPVDVLKAPEPSVVYTLPTATVGNMEAIEGFVANVEKFFADVKIDPTNPEQVKQLKALRADVNKAATAIDDKRKGMDKDVKAAMADADKALNTLRDRLKAVYAKTGEQIAEADRLWADARRSLLQGEYEAVAPALVELITLDAFIGAEPKLMQKQWGGNKACNALDDMVERAVQDRDQLAQAGLAHPNEADAVYCRTLDVRAALAEDKRLKDAEAAAAEHAAKAQALRETIERPRPKPEPKPEPRQEQPQPLSRYTFEFDGTYAQAAEVKRLLVSMGVGNRTMKKVRLG